MNHDEHQRERMRAWTHVAAHTDTDNADYMLAAFDKRFPAPVEPNLKRSEYFIPPHELATLRQKARLWDAMWPVWYGQEDDAINAARKVIDAGALK